MKTKVLLSTMVLAAAFASCSQDEWEVNNANTGLDNRRAVGNVELTFPGASTRMVQNEAGKIVFAADDKVGAHLMDQFSGKYPVTQLKNDPYSNYPFEQNGDVWQSTGVLLEGNYFFSYPFDGCQQNRGAVINTVPVDQYLYDENGEFNGLQSYLDNQFYVGYKYLHADENCEDCTTGTTLTANVEMEMVHAYPVFQFLNQTGSPLDEPLKVYKVSLRKKDHSLFYNTVAIFPKGMGFKADPNGEDQDGKYDLWKTAVYNRNMPGNNHVDAYPYDAEQVCSSKTLEYNLIFPEGGLEVKNWDSFKAYMIVPAGVYGPMEAVLYTNEGVGTFDIDMPNDADDSQVQSGTYTLTPAKKAVFSIRVDINSLKTNKFNITVQSTENLVEYLKYIGDTGNQTKIELTTVGDEVELNQEVYEILKNENLKLKLNGALVIPEGVPADAIDRIDYYYAGAKLINKGTQVVTETPMKEKATIGAANVRIDNYGTLTLQAAMPASLINNYGTLTVDKSTVHTLLNMPNAKTTVTGELNAINLFNMGNLNVNQGASAELFAKFFNIGTVDNDGTITTWPMDMTNPAFIQNNTVDFSNYVANTSVDVTIDLYNAFIAASAEAVNYGTINNSGTIDCKGVIVSSTLKNEFEQKFGGIEFSVDFEYTNEVAAVTSLVNLGSGSTINTTGRISNLSNFGMLVPQPGSTTTLVEMEADDIFELNEANEAAKLYVQGGLAFYGYGFIDQTNNDKVDVSNQAKISGQGEELSAKQQIIFVKRTGDTNFNTKVDETSASAPKYINTIWFDNAKTTITSNTDISEYDFWMSGDNTVTIKQDNTLTLGALSITGTANFRGEGKVKLTENVYVNGGTLNADNTAWIADSPVTIWGYNYEDNHLNTEGISWSSNIKIDYNAFDYVGPWIVIE